MSLATWQFGMIMTFPMGTSTAQTRRNGGFGKPSFVWQCSAPNPHHLVHYSRFGNRVRKRDSTHLENFPRPSYLRTTQQTWVAAGYILKATYSWVSPFATRYPLQQAKRLGIPRTLGNLGTLHRDSGSFLTILQIFTIICSTKNEKYL